MTADIANYVYAYTNGSIAADQPVKVRFTSALVQPEEIGKPVDNGVFNLSPNVAGTAIWEDVQTIRFTPSEGFEPGKWYTSKIQLSRLFKNISDKAQEFSFEFNIREMTFALETDGIEPETAGDMTKQVLSGTLTTTDKVDSKKMEDIVVATENGKNLPVSWINSDDGKHHEFRIRSIERTNNVNTVKIKGNGKNFGINQTMEREVKIPAIGDFSIMNVHVVQGAGDQQNIKISFSDPLQTNQDVTGLIKINDFEGKITTSIEGNSILVYTGENLSGDKSVFVNNAVKNYQGKKLLRSGTYVTTFNSNKPQVRLVGKGVILPSDDGVNFPFEAINLNYVDVEILKIYNNNILQFLQFNGIDNSDNSLATVGKIIMQKKVALKTINPTASAMTWTRYGLDLSDLVKRDPTAIYQVRICFRKSYVNNSNCGGIKDNMATVNSSNDFEASDDNSLEFDTDNNSYFHYGWNGGEGGEQNYKEQNNPCNNSYYNTDNFIKRNVFCSNLGMIAKKGSDNSVFVAVSDLKSTAPKSGVKLDLYNYQQQVIASGATSNEGTFVFDKINGKPWCVVATNGNQKGYLTLGNNNSLNMSRFDVAGADVQKGIKGFLYGERGVWRPGDSLHLNFMLNDRDNKLPDNYPITLELYDTKGVLQYRTTSVENVKNIYPFNIATRNDAPTGKWRADIKVGGATFHQPLRIENVKPNRLKINFDLNNLVERGKLEGQDASPLLGDDKIDGKLQVNWLVGAHAHGLHAKIEATLASATSVFPKFRNYVFDDPTRKFKSEPAVIFDGNVDDNGFAQVKTVLPKVENAPGKLILGFKMRAFEQGGDFSSDYKTVVYAPYKSFVGVFIPKNKANEKRIDMNTNGTISFALVDKDGNPLKNRTIDVNVYRVEWHWWWERDEGDNANFESSKDMNVVMQKTVTTNSEGIATMPIKTDKWGRYLVRAGDLSTGHFSGDYFYSGYPWDDNDKENMSRDNAAMLSFSTDKEKYVVGENIEINIPTPEGGKALISIENGSKILENKWIDTRKGLTKYVFRATSEMSPNVYAFITLIQPHNNAKNDLPIRMFGVTPITVDDPKNKLEPIVKTPEVMKPEENATISVSEKNGRPMAYTIAIVDEGLLDLTKYETPNPLTTIYAREALGVKTFDVYDQVLGAYGGTLERLLNIGGDKAAKAKNAQVANRFKPVVMTLGPFAYNGGTKTHVVKIPNYVGSVRAMIVATDGQRAYGSGEQTTPVRKPLMVLATLPRTLSPQEKLKLPVDVFAMDPKIKNATITVSETSGLVDIVGQKSKQIAFQNIGDKIVDFDLAVGANQSGIAKFHIVAEGGGERATSDIEIDVRNPNPFVSDAKAGVANAGESVNFNYNAMNNGKATLEVSNIPPLNLASRLTYLIEYPYGCIEQTISAAFPQLYVDKLMNLDEATKKKTVTNIKATIDRLRLFQTPDGGFTYWPGGDYTDNWATNYAVHFLIEAKNAGYDIPTGMLDRWTKYAQQTAKRWTNADVPLPYWSDEQRDVTQAYRLFTLALNRIPENAAMNALREKKNLSVTARYALAAAYALGGKQDVSKQLVNNAPVTINFYREMSYTYGSDLRDQAMILMSDVLIGDKTQSATVAQEVSRKLNSGDWYGTQSVAFGLMAMSKYAQANGVGNGSTMSFAYNINGKSANFSTQMLIGQINLPLAGVNNLSVKNTGGKGQLFVRMVQRGQPPVGTNVLPNTDQNIKMTIAYKTQKGEPINISQIKQGTDFIAEVMITNTGALGKNFKELALTQVFPAGWEIINMRMNQMQTATNASVPRYLDIRDDRVNTFFDVDAGKTKIFRVQLNASYVGKFWMPTQSCEAMYDNSVSARQGGFWVEVLADEGKKTM